MATHDYAIADQNGLSFLSDLNSALSAIVSNNSSATEPASTFAYMWWADTTAGILKQRNAANTAWINKLSLTGTGLEVANNLSDVASALTAFNNIKQAATEAATGVVEKATLAELKAGTADKYPDATVIRNNILGTVSQSAGVPTGAVIERSSNANGEYVKFADGTMICAKKTVSQTTSNAYDSFFVSPSRAETLPASFVGDFYSSGCRAGETVANGWTEVKPAGASSVNVITWSNSSTSTGVIHITVVGRWF